MVIYTLHYTQKAAQETIGKKKKFRSRKGLRIGNEEIEKAIEEKQKRLKNNGYNKILRNPKTDIKRNVTMQKQLFEKPINNHGINS
jgi:uncharacterized protein YllA (UPF0747 family)